MLSCFRTWRFCFASWPQPGFLFWVSASSLEAPGHLWLPSVSYQNCCHMPLFELIPARRLLGESSVLIQFFLNGKRAGHGHWFLSTVLSKAKIVFSSVWIRGRKPFHFQPMVAIAQSCGLQLHPPIPSPSCLSSLGIPDCTPCAVITLVPDLPLASCVPVSGLPCWGLCALLQAQGSGATCRNGWRRFWNGLLWFLLAHIFSLIFYFCPGSVYLERVCGLLSQDLPPLLVACLDVCKSSLSLHKSLLYSTAECKTCSNH